ncbi:hypothetical protein IV102_17935 [bacterium]|nr:hypothetical protein [bacterium]
MKCCFYFLCMAGAAWAAPTYHQKIAADLNGDSVNEQVCLQRYTVGGVSKGQLVVLDSKGRILWSAPRVKDAYSESPWSFLGEFDMGDISWVDDYDQDGHVDLCATEQKSDVRPTNYKLFHWDGSRFVYDRTAMLVVVPQKPATYQWARFDPSVSSWVQTMKRIAKGQFAGEIVTIPDPSEKVRFHYQPGEGFIRE